MHSQHWFRRATTSLLSVLAVCVVMTAVLVRSTFPIAAADNDQATSTSKTIAPHAARATQAPVTHLSMPKEVRGIYWTVNTAGGSRVDSLLAYMHERQLNTVVIDLKTDNGELGFTPNNATLEPLAMAHPVIRDLDGLLKKLGEQKIYRIARIPMMRNSTLATLHPDMAVETGDGGVWHDKSGASWVDPAAPFIEIHALALAREAYSRGFDEIQFDYVRFPTDGSASIAFPFFDAKKTTMEKVMNHFFATVGGTLKREHIPTSFDLFGIVLWMKGDTNIGQHLADIMPNADFVSPMVYPSHYPPNFNGYKNPSLYPYEIIKETIDKGIEILSTSSTSKLDETTMRKQMRPWIQDFDLGVPYTADRIEAEIKAVRDAGSSGFLIWNARNVYTPADYLKQ